MGMPGGAQNLLWLTVSSQADAARRLSARLGDARAAGLR
jgi:hypothetical protein